MKRADEVLARAQVDTSLAADRAIDLRQERRRHLDESDAAQIRRGGKSRHVADHAAAERDDGARAVEPAARELVVEAPCRSEGLGPFAVANEDRLPGRSDPQSAAVPTVTSPPPSGAFTPGEVPPFDVEAT